MDKLVRKIEVPLAKSIVTKAGLYLVPKERLAEQKSVLKSNVMHYAMTRNPKTVR